VESENVVSDVEIRGAMDRAAMNAFLNEPILARIATVRGTGRMWCRCGSTGTATRTYRKCLGEEGISAPTPRQMIANPHAIIRLHPQRIRTWDDTRTGLAPLP
jgi:hypothetical protein